MTSLQSLNAHAETFSKKASKIIKKNNTENKQ
ncbi:Uncharacterised protein [Porphyromonas macacae]|uniref:Uncharacterized protein n=1 Tax=Porphyromonas macacae TaxID=28115 RepID=A0A379DET0_9PORP|nr:Uncharacterised protein [Porphyromonas macacae]SUB88288.1 Uncharacterised protein [Porphyromonas macacae]SUB88819.1 Uncharacterised protein [Porphyromonas macacae]SUB89479.1 Uncharacterised protein [Porphyromonas macacae]